MSADPGRIREEALSEEYREWFLDRKLGPMDPEVAAILGRWENGSDEEPWTDARPEGQERSDEEEPHGFPAAGEGTAA